MRSRVVRLFTPLIILALGVGCAHKQAINQANAYAEQGKWRAAYAQCQRALEIDPDSEDARACAADTRPKATNAALEDARSELRERRYAAALKHLDYVDSIHPEPPTASRELRAAVRDAVELRLRTYLDEGDMEEAYRFSGTARQLYSGARFVEDARATCREHFRQRAAQFEEQERYQDALDALGTIRTYEPERSEQVRQEQDRIKGVWARSLEADARDLVEKDRLAGAAVNYARAYELASREKTRAKLQRLTDQIRAKTTFGVEYELDGPRDWREPIGRRIGSHLDEHVGLARSESTPALEIGVELESSDCSDSATGTIRKSVEYVSGTRRVANPQYDEYEADLVEATRDLEDARQEEAELEQAYNERERAVRDFRAESVAPLKRELQGARTLERDLEARVQSSRQLVQQGEDQLERLENDEGVSDETIAAQRMTLQTLRKDLYQKEARLQDATKKIEELESEWTRVEADLERMRRERDDLFTRHKAAERDVSRAEERVADLQRKLDTTPRTLEEDVIDTFAWDATTWRRTCKAVVQLDVAVADTEKTYGTTLKASEATEDVSHQAYEQYGVRRDPLTFPTDDITLWKRVDTDLANQVIAKIDSHARKCWNRRIAESVDAMTDRPHFAADLLLSVYLSAPNTLEQGELSALEEHLQEHYGASPIEQIVTP